MDGATPFFAYGAKMRAAALEQAGITPLGRERARLRDHRIAFDLPGIPLVEPAFASFAAAPGEEVHGVLWWIASGQMRTLDRHESPRYRVVEVEIEAERSGIVRAEAYKNETPVFGLRPSRRYLRLIAEGAREAELPPDYVARLVAQESVHLPVLSPLMTLAWKVFLATRPRR